MSTTAAVKLWGRLIGAVTLPAEGPGVAAFEYAPEFVPSGIQIAPLMMPLKSKIYSFPQLGLTSFHGLPGLLADSLPDKFGNALIDTWLASQGLSPGQFNAVQRLCYIGTRGMGALEFEPALGPTSQQSVSVQVAELVTLASEILQQRSGIKGSLSTAAREESLRDILRVGTSAGGARAKAVIAWNPQSEEIRSGQVDAGDGFEYWLLKFDGVTNNRDKELADPLGFGAIEYAYSLMARSAGIEMSECRLLEEGGRRHFMTKRFDRLVGGSKLHMQSLAAMAHLDFNAAGVHSYEQALRTIRQLGLPMASIEEQFRRMAFNICARNQDDHVKNIAFLMNKQGKWALSPAFDVTYAYNPDGAWTAKHQMSLNGKTDGFTIEDFTACAKFASMKRGRAQTILDEVRSAVTGWTEFAEQAKVPESEAQIIAAVHRTELPTN